MKRRVKYGSAIGALVLLSLLVWILARRAPFSGPPSAPSEAETTSGPPRPVPPGESDTGPRPREGPWIDGRTIDGESGEPVRCLVRLVERRSTGLRYRKWMETGEEGVFRMDGLEEGSKVYIEASARGGELRSYTSRSPLRVTAGRNPFVVSLLSGATIEGRVVDAASGKPVPKARIHHTGGYNALGWDLIAGPDGSFVLHGVFGMVGIVATAPGYGEYRWHDRLLPGFEKTLRITLPLPGERPVAGVVRDAAGRPLPGIMVDVHFHGRNRVQKTDARGRFRIHEVPEGVPLTIYLARYRSPQTPLPPGVFGSNALVLCDYVEQIRVFPPGKHTDALEFVMVRSAEVRGLVIDDSGSPFPYAPVLLQSLKSKQPRRAAEWMQIGETDDHGRFRIVNVPPGDYECTTLQWREIPVPEEDRRRILKAPGLFATFSISEGEKKEGLELPAPGVVVLRGRVVEPGGEPIREARRSWVRISARSAVLDEYHPWNRVRGDGTFHLAVLRMGFPYSVVVECGGSNITNSVVIPDPVEKEILLKKDTSRFGTLLIRVFDSRGKVIRDFDAFLNGRARGTNWDMGKKFHNAVRGGRWEALEPGQYRLRVGAPHHDLVTYGFVDIHPNGHTDVRVTLPGD